MIYFDYSISVQICDHTLAFLTAFEQDGDPNTYLLGIGSFFVFVSLCFKLQGKVLLSHIGNGGLMQVLWLARKLQQTDDIKNQNALSTDASSVVGEKVAADS